MEANANNTQRDALEDGLLADLISMETSPNAVPEGQNISILQKFRSALGLEIPTPSLAPSQPPQTPRPGPSLKQTKHNLRLEIAARTKSRRNPPSALQTYLSAPNTSRVEASRHTSLVGLDTFICYVCPLTLSTDHPEKNRHSVVPNLRRICAVFHE